MFTKCKFKSTSHIQIIQKILFVENKYTLLNTIPFRLCNMLYMCVHICIYIHDCTCTHT